ncbi:polysaccharide deacetylase family protein [Thiomonas sp. FB-Cd]|uniref:polysaccharide deacetylase family protein n=1 Tax=Thiomonas sp. FB-Cd TaxID=1158292 RepID=UPI0004DF778E|nr:polysaccharide deacetylase family protein [Thiomonas sp. FB-Cd]
MSRISILMYHALWESEAELQAIAPEDRPYAISISEFGAQLHALRENGIAVLDPKCLENGASERGGVILTFDDGHASNAVHALPALQALNMPAAFFVTTGFVGTKAGFCTWAQIRSLADAGMTVGGHGHSHRFLSGLDYAAQRDELFGSHSLLERELGRPVRQMSFPGGRCDAASRKTAREAGFSVLYASKVGTIAAAKAAEAAAPLPRIAVRPGMAHPTFVAYARGNMPRMVRARAASHLKDMAKRLMGNERYHQLYTRLKG